MEEKRILMQLPFGELNVAAIIKELTDRKVCVPFGSKMLKSDLSELLRMTLEKTQSPATLIQLRAYEIAAIQNAGHDTLVAKLKSRGLNTQGGDRQTLLMRLYQVLQQEKAEFERQNKENVPPFQDQKPPAITPEQRDRIEHNRKRAVELQQFAKGEKREKLQHTESSTVSFTPIQAAPMDGHGSIEVADMAQVTFDYCSPGKVENSRSVNPYKTLKSTGIASPVANLYSPVVPIKLNYKGLGTPALTKSFSPCTRCSDTCAKQKLCLVWSHSGDIQKELTSSGYNHFRWDCCGRLDGQPCFVGRHSRGSKSTSSTMVMCNCRDAALLRCTRKPSSPNRGRYFFKCDSGSCNFFRWADEAYGLCKDIPRVAPDGVREWEIPFANPYGEPNLAAAADQGTNRKRLVAALVLQEMCACVHSQGQGGINCNGICSKELSASVLQTVHQGGDAILWKLQPLTSDQLRRRFGWPNTPLVGLNEPECEQVLRDLLENSQVVKSVGIRYDRGPVGESSVFVDLAGLESYLHC